MDIDVRISQGRKPRHILVVHNMTLLPQGGQGRVNVTGVRQDNRVQNEPECTELVLLALTTPLA